MPVPPVATAKAEDRRECLSSIELPKPRVVAVSLAPAPTVDVARINRFVLCADAARARVEARMALAELRGTRVTVNGVRRLVVLVPDVDVAEPPPAPATL